MPAVADSTRALQDLTTLNTALSSDLLASQQALATLKADLSSLRSHNTALVQSHDSLQKTTETQLAELRAERTKCVKELAAARMEKQDLEVRLGGMRKQVADGGKKLVEEKEVWEGEKKALVEEGERKLRDHVTEADGSVLSSPRLLFFSSNARLSFLLCFLLPSIQ
jgi:regulator of replication initiation timing